VSVSQPRSYKWVKTQFGQKKVYEKRPPEKTKKVDFVKKARDVAKSYKGKEQLLSAIDFKPGEKLTFENLQKHIGDRFDEKATSTLEKKPTSTPKKPKLAPKKAPSTLKKKATPTPKPKFVFADLFKGLKDLDETKHRFWKEMIKDVCGQHITEYKDHKECKKLGIRDPQSLAFHEITKATKDFKNKCIKNGVYTEEEMEKWKKEADASIKKALESIRDIMLNPSKLKDTKLFESLPNFPTKPKHFIIVHAGLLRDLHEFPLRVADSIIHTSETGKIQKERQRMAPIDKFQMKSQISSPDKQRIRDHFEKRIEAQFGVLHRNVKLILDGTAEEVKQTKDEVIN